MKRSGPLIPCQYLHKESPSITPRIHNGALSILHARAGGIESPSLWFPASLTLLLYSFLEMAAKAEEAPPLPAAAPVDPPDPSADPALRRILVDKGRGEEEEEEEEEEEDGMDKTKEREARPREAKRRRTCPAALETTCSSLAAKEGEGDESSRAGRGEFSFSFDTRGLPPVETTPKFGFFRFPVADLGPGGAAEEERADSGGAEEGEGVAAEGKFGN
ncbi:hypothetical protein BHE74_00031032 [Ensete ventricosum]|nr:hypothetical protein BHE74_00031032 [Ensete ventricosum]